MLSLTSRFTIARNARLRTTIRACQHATIATTTRRCDALPLSDAQRRTIYALSTPPGKSGVALIRVSGPEALSVWQRMVRSTRGARDKGDQGSKPSPRLPEPWKMQRCHILDPHSSDILDEALAVFFRGAPGTSQKSSPLSADERARRRAHHTQPHARSQQRTCWNYTCMEGAQSSARSLLPSHASQGAAPPRRASSRVARTRVVGLT